jgi:hypothetical protein
VKPCRECQHPISDQAFACPACGAPFPARPAWTGWGFGYRTKTRLFGLPLLDISFRFGPNRMPVPAVGVIAIGQFAAGIVTIAQFGVGVFSLSQFTLAFYAVAQVAIAWSCIAQVGLYVERGYGQAVWQIGQLLGAP